jgi:tetratricopeptide (TPR) repeat protein
MLRVACLLVVFISTVAFAQQSAEVTKYLQATITLYENLEYAKALSQVQKAKSKAKTPDDEARCSVLEAIVLADMGRDEKASKAFQQAFAIDTELTLPVAVAPKIAALADKAREQVKKLLAPSLAQQKAEEAKKAAEEQAKLDASKAEEEHRRKEALALQQKADEERKKAMLPPAAVAKTGPSFRSMSWIPGAIGLLSAGVATAFFVSASNKLNALRSDMMLTPTNALIARDSGKSDATLGWVFSGVAVAGLGAAIVMFLMSEDWSPTPAVSLFITHHGGGVVWSGEFDFPEVLR